MIARTLGRLGRTLIAAGILVFLFLGYLLWGTGLQTAQAQSKLAKQFDREVAEAKAHLATTTTTSAPTTAPGSPDTTVDDPAPIDLPVPRQGDIVGKIAVPSMGLLPKTVVEGTDEEQLKRGPGHYPGTALPGQMGNVAIAGHRTTYGSPFHDIDQMRNGDKITITTTYGTFVYTMIDHKIVDPGDTSVLENHGQALLTLTACHPVYSASQRYIVIAKLDGRAVGKLSGQDQANKQIQKQLAGDVTTKRSLSSFDARHPAITQAVLWGLVCAAIWLAAWVVARFVLGRRHRWYVAWLPYVLGLPLFAVTLYVFFEHFVRQLPSNF